MSGADSVGVAPGFGSLPVAVISVPIVVPMPEWEGTTRWELIAARAL
jgi:hypothetical protein